MPATATAAPRRPDLSSRVPAEFVGRARVLRARVAGAHTAWVDAAGQLTAPLLPRGGFTPVFDPRLLWLIEARWKELPEWGRLRAVASTIDSDKLSIAELRIIPFRHRMAGWSQDELAVALGVIAVAMQRPSTFLIEVKLAATLGLHALARRYERGADRRDLAVLRDVLPIALAAPAALRAGGEFEVGAGDGRWIGSVMDCDRRSCLVVRTFVT
jgi:hypothetical protein